MDKVEAIKKLDECELEITKLPRFRGQADAIGQITARKQFIRMYKAESRLLTYLVKESKELVSFLTEKHQKKEG